MYDIGFDTALDHVLENIVPLGPEIVSTSDAVGRVCAGNVIALIDYPSSDSSLKDGYAVLSGDVERAGASNPIELHLVGTIGAGDESSLAVTTGCAVRVLSGASIPEGADAVLAEEFAEASQDMIRASACAEPGRNILFKGSEIRKDEILVPPGQRFSPATISLIVAGGLDRVSVFRRPAVGLLATGNEVLLPGAAPESGKLFASNLALQEAWLHSWSIRTTVRRAGDSFEELMTSVDSMLSECDVLLTSGGAWKGDRDLIVKALDALGWKRIFHRVRLGPGKAVGMGFLKGKPVFCLPGGPPSNEVAFLLIAFPGVLRMAGYTGFPYIRLTGSLTKSVGGQKDWTQAIHCRVEKRGGAMRLFPLEITQRLSSMAKADGLVLVREGVESIPSGATVEFICLDAAGLS